MNKGIQSREEEIKTKEQIQPYRMIDQGDGFYLRGEIKEMLNLKSVEST